MAPESKKRKGISKQKNFRADFGFIRDIMNGH